MEITFFGAFVTALPLVLIVIGTVVEALYPKYTTTSRVCLLGIWVTGYVISGAIYAYSRM